MPIINNLIFTCDSCKVVNEINSENIERRNVIINSEELQLTVLKCPVCKNEIIVQIDNAQTNELLKKQMQICALIGIKKYHDKNITKQNKKLKFFTAQLLRERENLSHKYENSVYYFQNQNKKIKLGAPTAEIVG